MKEKLIIKNFGPIKSVELDLGKITVLIGEQATGKSTIAKVLSMCRYFSYIVNYSLNDNHKQDDYNYNEQFYKGLKDWGIEGYLSRESYFFYQNSDYTFESKIKLVENYSGLVSEEKLINLSFDTYSKIKSNSIAFTELLNQLQDLKKDAISLVMSIIDQIYPWSPNENFFRLNVKKVMNNPLFIPVERGFQSLSVSKDSLLPDAILDELSKINRIVRGYNIDVNIEPFGIVLRNENGLSKIKKDTENEFYFLHQGASGFQSTIPIYIAVKFNNDTNVNRGRTIIVEEPELNLFPKTQKKLVEFFTESIKKYDNQFILPTHSPYILTTLSNLMYAHKIGTIEKGKYEKQVANIIPKKSWIDVNDVSVYFLNNGKAKDLVDVEECLINLDNLDNVSETINNDFDNLLELEMTMEKEM